MPRNINTSATLRIVAVLAWVSLAGLARAQQATNAALQISGDVPTPLTVTLSDLKGMPRTTVSVSQNGADLMYEGVLVGELLKRAGAPLGRDLSGPAIASYVLATGADGYQVVFSLGELDPALTSTDVVVADMLDGKPLSDPQGPFRIVMPHDKRGVRSVRMLQKLEVVRLRR